MAYDQQPYMHRAAPYYANTMRPSPAAAAAAAAAAQQQSAAPPYPMMNPSRLYDD